MRTIKLFTFSELLGEKLDWNHINALLDYTNLPYYTSYISYIVKSDDFFDTDKNIAMFEINNALVNCRQIKQSASRSTVLTD